MFENLESDILFEDALNFAKFEALSGFAVQVLSMINFQEPIKARDIIRKKVNEFLENGQ
jgi:hypothetical protein